MSRSASCPLLSRFPTTISRMALRLFFILCTAGVFSIPLDDPIRIDLPVYDQPQTTSDAFLSQPIESENYPGQNQKPNSILENLIPNSIEAKTNILHTGASESAEFDDHNVGLFRSPKTKINSVRLETEGYGSKVLSIKENAQNVVVGLLQPKPIVDTIREEEKYGNNGDKFYNAGRAIVGGAAKFSNFFNSLIEIPGAIIKSITRAATEKLNNFGSKIVGL